VTACRITRTGFRHDPIISRRHLGNSDPARGLRCRVVVHGLVDDEVMTASATENWHSQNNGAASGPPPVAVILSTCHGVQSITPIKNLGHSMF
jgi:hypothetical protein